jgi:hypothetical protein
MVVRSWGGAKTCGFMEFPITCNGLEKSGERWPGARQAMVARRDAWPSKTDGYRQMPPYRYATALMKIE